MNARRWVLVAVVIVLLLNLPLILGEFTMRNWDSQAHIFYASHYLKGWFDPWEEKWYTGFWVFAYPPLVHQLIAAISNIAGLGLEGAYRLVQMMFLLLLPVAFWLFSKELVEEREAAFITMLSAGLSGTFVILYTFGQLPSFASFIFALLAVRFLLRYLKSGKPLELAGWFFMTGSTVSAHHHTLLFVVFLSVVSVVALSVKQWSNKLVPRTVLAALVFGVAVFLVIAPFWVWNFTQRVDQVPIPHPTRENIFSNEREARMFFWDMNGGMLLLFPLGIWAMFRRWKIWPIVLGVAFLFLIGLGGVTDFPRIVLTQGIWEILTFERFAYWAVAFSVIPVGIGLSMLPKKNWIYAVAAIVLLVGIARANEFRNRDDIIPEPLIQWEETEIVRFLNEHKEFRYVTFGLGEPELVRLSRLTDAQTVDGFFNQARWRELQANSGIGTIDSSPWVGEKSYNVLFPMLQRPWEWNLRWAVVRNIWIKEHLENSGWKLLHPIGKDDTYRLDDPFASLVTIWEAPPVNYLPISDSVISPDAKVLTYWWGIIPLSVLLISLLLLAFSLKREEHSS